MYQHFHSLVLVTPFCHMHEMPTTFSDKQHNKILEEHKIEVLNMGYDPIVTWACTAYKKA
jgi:hypothetical protein